MYGTCLWCLYEAKCRYKQLNRTLELCPDYFIKICFVCLLVYIFSAISNTDIPYFLFTGRNKFSSWIAAYVSIIYNTSKTMCYFVICIRYFMTRLFTTHIDTTINECNCYWLYRKVRESSLHRACFMFDNHSENISYIFKFWGLISAYIRIRGTNQTLQVYNNMVKIFRHVQINIIKIKLSIRITHPASSSQSSSSSSSSSSSLPSLSSWTPLFLLVVLVSLFKDLDISLVLWDWSCSFFSV